MSFRKIVRNPVQMIGGELCIMNKISPRTSFEMTRGSGKFAIRCFVPQHDKLFKNNTYLWPMQSRPQILTLDDIKLLVDTFYQKIKTDELLGPIFNERIQDKWPIHLEKMYRFWQTILLEEYTYNGRPFPPHAQLPVGPEHFAQWLDLFTKTVDELFAGDKATEAKWRANKMAEMFQHKIAYLKRNPLNIL